MRLSNSTAARAALTATKKRAAVYLRALLDLVEDEGAAVDAELVLPPTVIDLVDEPHDHREPNWAPSIDLVENSIDLDASEQVAFDEKLDAFLDVDAENDSARSWLLRTASSGD